MKKVRTLCLILCLSLLLGVIPAGATGNDLGCRTTDAAVALAGSDKLVETSTAVFVYERNSDTLVYSYNMDQQVYPASMVKLMTVLVAIENGDLDETVTVTSTALNSIGIGTVSVGLQRGEELKLRDLLYATMIASANDACAVVAEHIGGNQERFVQMMNDKAAELGCAGTNFSNSTGLHDENTYTTARDVCKIIDSGMENEEFKAIFQAETYDISATNKSEPRHLVTTNSMQTKEETSRYYDERVTGGKTGATDAAGRCLAVSADIGDMELIAIVMGAKPTYEVEGIVISRFGSFEEMEEILDFVEDSYEYRQIFYADQALAQYSVAGGANDIAVAPVDTLSCVLPIEATERQLSWSFGSELSSLTAPIRAGQTVSTLQVWFEGICVAQTDLVAMNQSDIYVPVTEPSLKDDPAEAEDNFGKIVGAVLIVVLIIAALAVVLLLIGRIMRFVAKKAQARRRRRSRRRNRNA